MGVYSKLQDARATLHSMELKKSGFNKFANYHYFELGDFVPQAQQIFKDVGLCPVFDFSGDTHVRLHIHDTESESIITFSSPMADAGVKGATAIQIVGSCTTYQRRYLYLQALEITENDIVDGLDAKDKKTPDAKPTPNEQKQAYKESLKSAQTLDELTAAWNKIPKENKVQELINVASERKRELTPINQQIDAAETMEQVTAICERLTPEQQSDFEQVISDKLDSFRLNELQGQQ